MSLRWPAATVSKSVLALLTSLMALGAVVACGGDTPDISVAVGRTLELHVTRPELTSKVAFLDTEGRHRIVRPRASNRQLALVDVTVVNRTSTVIPMLVDPEAARLGDRRGERIEAVDPFDGAVVADAADPEEGRYSPLLWGEVELARDFQVSGWMIFDVPKGLTLGSFWWDEVDDIVTDYIDYIRR